jgi:HEAT repeat protein
LITISELESKKWTERKKAASLYGKIENEKEAEKVIPEMSKALTKDDNAKVRKEIAVSLSKLSEHAEEAVPALIEAMMNDKSRHVREWAAIALGEIGPKAKKAIPKLVEVMKNDSSPTVIKKAILSLGKMGLEAEKIIPDLEEYRKEHNNWWVNSMIRNTIIKIQHDGTMPEDDEDKK